MTRIINVQQVTAMSWCARCQIEEVAHDGDICRTCKWLESEKRPNPALEAVPLEPRSPLEDPYSVNDKLAQQHIRRRDMSTAAFDRAGVTGPQGARPLNDRDELKPKADDPRTLTCKWPGCENKVNSHKGLAGWCAEDQDDRPTHRQQEIERRRGEDPAYGRRRAAARGPRKIVRPAPGKPPAFDVAAVEANEALARVTLAEQEYEHAAEELQAARDNAEAKLRTALDALVAKGEPRRALV